MGYYSKTSTDGPVVGNEKSRGEDFWRIHHRNAPSRHDKAPASKAFFAVGSATFAPDAPLYGYRHLSTVLGRWINRDPINERGQKLLGSGAFVIGIDKDVRKTIHVDEERNCQMFVVNSPVLRIDYLGLFGPTVPSDPRRTGNGYGGKGKCPDFKEKCACVLSPHCTRANCRQAAADADQARRETQRRFPRSRMHNDSADAWRHCFWSCQMARSVGVPCARDIGNNHEDCGDRYNQPANERAMDEHNNEVGRNCASSSSSCSACCSVALGNGDLVTAP